MPEQAGGRGHRVAGDEAAALAGGPGIEVSARARLRKLQEIPAAGVQYVVGAPGLEVRAESSGQQGGRGGVEGGSDGLDGAALRGGAGEAFIPVGDGRGREGRVGVREVDLRLDALIADPESVATAGAERAAGHRRARHGHRRQVDRAVVFLQEGSGRRGGPLHAAGHQTAGTGGGTADEAHEIRRGDRILRDGAEEVDEHLAFAARVAAGDLAGRSVEVGAVRQVMVQEIRVGELLVAAVDGERRGQPTEEEARVVRIGDVPVARLGRVDAAGGPDAGPVTTLVRDRGGLVGVGERSRRYRGGRRRGHVRREHVRAHRDALVGAGHDLQLRDRDAGRGERVEARPQEAGVGLRETAFHLQERGEDDHHHDHRRHDGQRQHERETRTIGLHGEIGVKSQ